MAYASPADMVLRYDANTLSDLLSDTGEAIADLTNNASLLAMLAASSGRLEAALLVSNHYTVTELASLTGNSLALIKDIVCDLTMARVLRRRPEKIASEALQAVAKEAEEYLDRLRKGDRIFDLAAHEAAGTPDVDGPSAADYEQLNLIPDRTKHFYPPRALRLPLGRL